MLRSSSRTPSSGIASGTCEWISELPTHALHIIVANLPFSWYIWPDLPNTTKPILLIPSKQVETLLKDINNAVDDAHLILGTEAEEIGLVIRFPNHPDLLPRYLGHSTCREQFVRLERHVPNAVRRRKGEIPHKDAPNNRTAQEWRRQMEMAFDVAKGKSRASKNTRKEQRAEKQQAWKGSLRKAERALGLRPALLRENGQSPAKKPLQMTSDSLSAEPAANAPWSEIKAFHNHRDQAYHDCKHPPPANPMEPPRWPFEDSPVFISVDIECYEHNKGQITEIGLATLDTNDLEGIAPSDKGQGWHPKIRPRHFRIREHAHLFNSDYVSGCADRFEFGESEMIALADVPAKIAECFRHPFSAKSSASTAASQSAHDSGAQDPRAKSTSLDSSNGPSSSDFSNTLINLPLGPSQTATTPNKPIPRKIILLGHDLSQDIRYLLRLGYQPLNNPHVTTLDTSELHRALIREWQPKSLAGILYDFELLAWNLHNGGNDAVYTLWIMLAICVKSAKERGDVEVKREREEKRKSAVEEAARKEVERVWEEGCGWSDDGDQEEEGGVSVSSGNGVW